MYYSLKQIFEKLQNKERLTFLQNEEDCVVFYIQSEKMLVMNIKKADLKEYKKEELYLKEIGYYFRHGYTARFD